jgi:Putative auto-transporter adhesin, head GIN domain
MDIGCTDVESSMIKNRRRSTLVLGAGLLVWTACAVADEPVRQAREISQPFDEVRLDADIDLELSQSDSVSLVIEAPREELTNIRSEVKDGVLVLERPDSPSSNFSSWFRRHQRPRALLSAPSIERLVVDGSGNAHAGTLTSHAFEIRISGSGDVKIDRLAATRLRCDVAGSGKVVLAGSVTNQRVRLSGSGDYRAADLKSEAATLSVSGSGDAELWAERTLDARISGSGDLRYYGTPIVTKSVSGSGSVTAMGDKKGP